MPSSLRAGYELQQLAVAANEEVGGDPQVMDGLVIRMRAWVQAIGEKLDDPVTTELIGRQADRMDHHQFDIYVRRTGITIG